MTNGGLLSFLFVAEINYLRNPIDPPKCRTFAAKALYENKNRSSSRDVLKNKGKILGAGQEIFNPSERNSSFVASKELSVEEFW